MHTDKIGSILEVDDIVVVAKSNSLCLAKVIRFTPKMVVVHILGETGRWRLKSEFRAYPVDVAKVDPQQALMFLLNERQYDETNR